MEPAPPLSALQGGRYELLKKLGEGGKGVVYRARDSSLDRAVAVKILKKETLDDEGYQRFLREAQIAARLTHPNVVAIFDMGREGGRSFLVMELIDGPSLRGVLEAGRGKPLGLPEGLKIAIETSRALRYAHGKGVLHRDIKPENIMINGEGTTKLADFGLAMALGQPRLTDVLTIVGTPAYMAPEVALGKQSDARSDLYSLGAVLYEMLTGRPPFSGTDTMKLVYSHIHDPPTPPSRLGVSIPPGVESLVMRLLSKNPDDRPASAESLVKTLEEQAKLLPEPVPPSISPPEGPARFGTPTQFTSPSLRRTGRLIAREMEIAALQGVLDRTKAGEGGLVFLTGEAGIGKTRLAEEARAYAAGRGLICLNARCEERDASIAFAPWVVSLRSLTNRVPTQLLYKALGPNLSAVIKLVPELSEKVGPPIPTHELPADQERLRFLDGVADFLVSIAVETPLLLEFDDLPLADAPSLELLVTVARKSRGRPLAVIAMCRDLQADTNAAFRRAILDLNRDRLLTSIPLHRLDAEGVARLVSELLGDPEVTPEFRDLLYEKTGGNPFFVEEVLHSLAEEGTIFRTPKGWGRKSTSEIHLPLTVRSVIQQRLSRLDEETLSVLRTAALAGNEFSFELLLRVSELSEDRLLEHLEKALSHGLLREHTLSATRVVYEFSDRQIRETLAEDVSMIRGRRYHLKIAKALEAEAGPRASDRAGELAFHYLRGNDLPKARAFSLEAARKSASLFAFDDARRHYQVALDLLEADPDDGLSASVWEELGLLDGRTGRIEQERRDYRTAAGLYEKLGRNREAASVLRRLAENQFYAFYDPAEAARIVDKALALLGTDADSPDRAPLLLLRSVAASLNRNWEVARGAAEEALAISRRLGARAFEARALSRLADLLPAQDAKRMVPMLQEASRIAQGTSEEGTSMTWRFVGTALSNALLWVEGDPDGALAADQSLLDAADKLHDLPLKMDHQGQNMAYVLEEGGRLTEARKMAEATFAFAIENYGAADAMNEVVLGRVLVLQGEEDRGLKLVRRGCERGMRIGGSSAAMYRNLLAQVHILLGDLPKADAELRRAAEEVRGLEAIAASAVLVGFVDFCTVELRFQQGSLEGTEDLLRRADVLARTVGGEYFNALAERAHGLVWGVQGETTRATAALQSSAARWLRLKLDYIAARTIEYSGEILQRAGDREAAAAALTRAQDMFTKFESKLDVDRVVSRKEVLKA